MFARYKKERRGEKDHFQFVEQVSLFGCNEGYIPWLLRKRLVPSQGEPCRWHVEIVAELAKTEYAGSSLVIDLKPKQKETNLSLYEVCDAWGYSDEGWTPILLYLSGLFVDVDPKKINRNDFVIEDRKRTGPIYEFLYLAGTIANGRLTGKWTAPPASPTNAALLWPESVRYFTRCIEERSPGILYSTQLARNAVPA